MEKDRERIRNLLQQHAPPCRDALDDPSIAGKTVLVTGAGGSIGAELCRQVAVSSAKRLILLGRGENSIYQIREELGCLPVVPELRVVIGDVCSRAKMRDVFQRERPDIVFHAAAHKHVALVERFPEEGVRNNVLGTQTVVQVALDTGVEALSLISTDKAVYPTSVYGCTKKLAEAVMQQAAATSASRLVTVRFGNVVRSRGSVVPRFERQIARGGAVTVSDPEMRRYFKSIDDAVSLVLQSLRLAKGGELCVLDMGEPIRILDVAEVLIEMRGKRPYKEIEIVFTGAQASEKMEETLLTPAEAAAARREGNILITPAQQDDTRLDQASKDVLFGAAERCDRQALLAQLSLMVAGYEPVSCERG